MVELLIIQGRNITAIEIVCDLMLDHSDWQRTWLSEKICCLWYWRNTQKVNVSYPPKEILTTRSEEIR